MRLVRAGYRTTHMSPASGGSLLHEQTPGVYNRRPFSAPTPGRFMKQRTKVLILLSVSSLVSLTLVPAAAGQSCLQMCMDSSQLISGMTYQHKYELCEIRCKGKDLTSWGAIAYSKRDKISGWSFEQVDRASAERVALQYCNQNGGVKCLMENSFYATCGAVAAAGDLVALGTAGTEASAQQFAMAECTKLGGKKCEVEASVCSAHGSSNSSGTPPPPPPPQAISWGAIAYSSTDMGAGWSQGKNDRASAEKEAMAVCAQRGKGCVLRAAFNKQCGALAADRNFTGSGVSADQRQALQQALDTCRKAGGTRCVPHISFCSF